LLQDEVLSVKSAVLRKLKEPLVFGEFPEPTIGRNKVPVQTKAVGICGTDLHTIEGRGYTPDLPNILGHEPAGIVAAVDLDSVNSGGHAVYARSQTREFQIQRQRHASSDHWQVLTQAILLGGHIKVAMEDNPHVDAQRTLCKSNAELLDKIVRIAREVGSDIASPDEARAITGLVPQADKLVAA
jgi:threonine dehydrogenase-like Zn-dependent dehydrogenase